MNFFSGFYFFDNSNHGSLKEFFVKVDFLDFLDFQSRKKFLYSLEIFFDNSNHPRIESSPFFFLKFKKENSHFYIDTIAFRGRKLRSLAKPKYLIHVAQSLFFFEMIPSFGDIFDVWR